MKEYDVIVIGAGPGGYIAAIRAAELGLKTACVDKGKTLGGTCVNVGCIPSKALLHTSENYYFMKNESAEIGITFSDVNFNFDKIMQHKTEVVDGLCKSVEGLFKNNKIDRIQGTAQFINPNTIQVENEQLSAKNFILATGSEPIPLPFAPFDEKIIVSSTGALSLKQVPKDMVVIGAGVIGVELASVYSRLGSRVTVVEMLDKITPAFEDALSRALLQSLKKQGITFHLAAKVTKIESKQVYFEVNNEALTLPADVVLVAIGRRPYTKGLGLDKIGVEKTEKGFVVINANFQTNIPNIYAIGDIVDGPMLAHKASDEGIAVAEIIAGLTPKVNYANIPNVVYTFPELASTGLTEAEAIAMKLSVIIGTTYYKGNPRARCSNYKDGIVKVIGDASTGRLLGVHIFGAHASEMIGEAVVALQKQASLKDLADTSHAHPTLSESIRDACHQAYQSYQAKN